MPNFYKLRSTLLVMKTMRVGLKYLEKYFKKIFFDNLELKYKIRDVHYKSHSLTLKLSSKFIPESIKQNFIKTIRQIRNDLNLNLDFNTATEQISHDQVNTKSSSNLKNIKMRMKTKIILII